MVHAVLPKTHYTHLSITWSLVTAKPPFPVIMIDCMHQTDLGREHSILQYVILTLDVHHRLMSLCQKWELFLSSIGVKVNGQCCWDTLLSQQMLYAIDTSLTTIFSFSNCKPILRTTNSFSALTLLVGSFDPQNPVPDMTYFSGRLNPTQSMQDSECTDVP